MYAILWLGPDGRGSSSPQTLKFVAICQRILKREWEVLKGEVRGGWRIIRPAAASSAHLASPGSRVLGHCIVCAAPSF